MQLGPVLLCVGSIVRVMSAAMEDPHATVATQACMESRRRITRKFVNGEIKAAEVAPSDVLTAATTRVERSCTGVIMCDLASILFGWGRLAEAETFAERAVRIFDKDYRPEDPVFLHPLQVLFSVRFEQGKTGRARQTFHRLQSVRTERPRDRALVHGLAGVLLEAEGRLPEAHEEYSVAITDWRRAGLSETAEMAAVMTNFACLYTKQRRWNDALKVLDGALAIFASCKSATTLDRVKALDLRAVVHARQLEWQEAAQDLHDAVSIADADAHLDPASITYVLTNYVRVLRKTHHRREARSIENRVAALHRAPPAHAVVDVTELR
jgi:tetratricopeptide (TPR) repeat protein